ncbi:MAG: DUF4936 domain-containing protein [Leptothrix sp. (in: Bacteria)]|nr:DUF4936 domain-containing protein [Leptothrix sp. (in: b-proteobacteria)]
MTKRALLYVYYKVDAAQHDALAPRVRALQARLQARQPGLVCELLQRSEASQGIETWMETYRHAAGLGDELAAAIDAAARAAGLPQPRHTENFIPLR